MVKSKIKIPEEIRDLLAKARLDYIRGNTDAAIKQCLEIIKICSNFSKPYYLLAEIHKKGKYQD